jgi:hypothetical protein
MHWDVNGLAEFDLDVLTPDYQMRSWSALRRFAMGKP